MNSTPNPKAIEPNDVLIARADERLVHAYGQIARADEQIARVTEQLSKLEHDAARHPSAVLGRGPSRGRPALRGFIGLLLAACIFVAAFASQSSYGDAAKLIVARWVPQLIQLHRCRWKKGFPRSRAHLPFRWPRRNQYLRNPLRLRPHGKTSCRQPARCLLSWRSCSRRWRAI